MIPKFENEAAEAEWWFDNQDLLFEEFERAGQAGELRRGTVARLANAAAPVVALNPEDVAHAKSLAECHGLEYQTYVKMVLHQALQEEHAGA